jgi:hypothetical protein
MSSPARFVSLLLGTFALVPGALAQQPSVKVEPPALMSSRPIEKQTETSVLRDYLQAWRNLGTAMQTNQAEPLDASFIGTAHDKLVEIIGAQTNAGIRTRYQDISHDLQFVFYSTEGQSIELVDNVQYDEQISSSAGSLPVQHLSARYVVVLTPSDVQWRVRIFQGGPSAGTAH